MCPSSRQPGPWKRRFALLPTKTGAGKIWLRPYKARFLQVVDASSDYQIQEWERYYKGTFYRFSIMHSDAGSRYL